MAMDTAALESLDMMALPDDVMIPNGDDHNEESGVGPTSDKLDMIPSLNFFSPMDNLPRPLKFSEDPGSDDPEMIMEESSSQHHHHDWSNYQVDSSLDVAEQVHALMEKHQSRSNRSDEDSVTNTVSTDHMADAETMSTAVIADDRDAGLASSSIMWLLPGDSSHDDTVPFLTAGDCSSKTTTPTQSLSQSNVSRTNQVRTKRRRRGSGGRVAHSKASKLAAKHQQRYWEDWAGTSDDQCSQAEAAAAAATTASVHLTDTSMVHHDIPGAFVQHRSQSSSPVSTSTSTSASIRPASLSSLSTRAWFEATPMTTASTALAGGPRIVKPRAVSAPTPIESQVNYDVNSGVSITTANLRLTQMRSSDWARFKEGSEAGGNNHSRLHDSFEAYIRQWDHNHLGPFLIYTKDAVSQTKEFFAGLVKFSLSNDMIEGQEQPCLHIRFTFLQQYRCQRRVMYEALVASLEWLLQQEHLFDQYEQLHIPSEVSASRENAICLRSLAAKSSETRVMFSSSNDCCEVQEGGQLQMIRVSLPELQEIVVRLEQHLESADMIPHIINEDIWTTRSENGSFVMRVMWEIPLMKIDEDHSIRLFMSTYHDTPVTVDLSESFMASQEVQDGGSSSYKLRVDLCQVEPTDFSISESPERCCRIKTKEVVADQPSISFNGVRKPKVGDKSKMYVIRSQLWRSLYDGDLPEVMDTCFSNMCQLTSSRRAYRCAEERIGHGGGAASSSGSITPVSDMSFGWESSRSSKLVNRFADNVRIGWKTGFPKWLYTQERVLLEVGNVIPSAELMKVQLIDVQSNNPVQLVRTMSGGTKKSSLVLTSGKGRGSNGESVCWGVDLRVYSKKEVQNRQCYLVVSFFGDGDDDEPTAEFTSSFVLNVGTTYANLKKNIEL